MLTFILLALTADAFVRFDKLEVFLLYILPGVTLAYDPSFHRIQERGSSLEQIGFLDFAS
jgi:ammonia channel protein AmtB